MKSLSPDFSEAISVSVSAFGTMTTLLAVGFSGPQYVSFGTRTSWSAHHESIFHSRPENGICPEVGRDVVAVGDRVGLDDRVHEQVLVRARRPR